jgi:pimeloyl-ACP methyl ester carboxylesterase
VDARGPLKTRRRDRRRTVLLAAEPARAAAELLSSAVLAPVLAAQPRGDGHCVLVIPGWLSGDRSTLPLRRYLAILGYEVHGWGQGVNRGATLGNVAGLQRRLTELARSSGRSVSLIGWSLGGHYAYQLARRNPAKVRQVITLGSPATMRWTGGRAASRLADRLADGSLPVRPVPRIWDEAGSLRVPITAIHSRSDPIVAWRTSLVRSAEKRQDVQVYSSHLGLGHNPAVLHVIADRLATHPERRQPFRPAALLRPLFPTSR